MFNDPKFKNLVNDISGILDENIKKHFDNLLPEAIVDQVSLAADKIEEIPTGARTAEAVGKIMKDHFFEGVRNAKVHPNNEMSAEFYRRVFEMKKNKKKNDKANGAY
jgi:hypothetical protein